MKDVPARRRSGGGLSTTHRARRRVQGRRPLVGTVTWRSIRASGIPR